MTDVKAVLFDLGDTLIRTADVAEILQRILSLYGVKRPLLEIEKARREAELEISTEDYGLPYMEFWTKWNLRILKRLGIVGDLNRLSREIVRVWWDNAGVELYPDVAETIEHLKERNLKLGIVTNGFKNDIDEILPRVGLREVFEITVGVDAVGKPKPHKDIFLYAVERLGIRPHEALFVGDSFEIDYLGALRAGLKALLIDRDGVVRNKGVHKIRSLLEIVKHL
jgi:putative hydrolase of the HAD superfamily